MCQGVTATAAAGLFETPGMISCREAGPRGVLKLRWVWSFNPSAGSDGTKCLHEIGFGDFVSINTDVKRQ